MRHRCYGFRSMRDARRWMRAATVIAAMAVAKDARAQACCAGSSAVTPARLALHEDALVGVQLRAASVIGSFDAHGDYRGSPAGVSELDFEEDLFGAVRFLERGQASLLVPFLETHRATRTLSETGGGIGDLNLSARWDFTRSGESRVVPGIAM